MKKNPLVSVIVPSYNHEKFVVKTLESILAQTYQHIELIVVDDCSKDSSALVIDRFCKGLGASTIPVNFYRNPQNIGLVKTLDFALAKVSGDFYCVVASDDIFEKEKVQRQVDTFENLGEEVGAIWSNARRIDENGQFIMDSSNQPVHVTWVSAQEINSKTPIQNYQYLVDCDWFIPTPSLMFRTSVARNLGFYASATVLEDLDAIFRLLKRYNYYFLAEDLVRYRVHSDNFVTRNGRAFRIAFLAILWSEMPFATENGLKSNLTNKIVSFLDRNYPGFSILWADFPEGFQVLPRIEFLHRTICAKLERIFRIAKHSVLRVVRHGRT